MALPHLGLTQEVRVCDGCYMKNILDKKDRTRVDDNALSSFTNSVVRVGAPAYDLTPTAVNSSTATGSMANSQDPDGFDADIKKAIELSLKEEERKKGYGTGFVPASVIKKVEPPKPKQEEEEDPDLAAAIAASLRETRISSTASSLNYGFQNSYSSFAPVSSATELTSVEMENISLFSTLIERLQAAGGNVIADPQIQALYEQIGTMQPKLVKSLDEVTRRQGNFVAMHDKVTQAVKLYDHLLEERLSNAAYYRTQQAAAYARPTSPRQYHAAASYMSPTQGHSSIYPTVSSYASPPPPQPVATSPMYPAAAPSTAAQSYAQYTSNLYPQQAYGSTPGQPPQPSTASYQAPQTNYGYPPAVNGAPQQGYQPTQQASLQAQGQLQGQLPPQQQQLLQQAPASIQPLYAPAQQPVQEAAPLIEF